MQEVHCSFYKKINELDDGTYSIARYHAISEVPKLALWKQDIFTVLGRDLPRQKNREIIFYGEWKENIYKKRKSLQFHAERFKVLLPETKEAIQEVLADEVPGIGKKTAKAIVDAFGTDTFQVLKEPPKHETIPRIKLMAVRNFIKAEERKERLCYLMGTYDLKKGQARKVLKAFGEDATEMLDANIYNLYKAGISLADIEMNHEPSEEEKNDTIRIRCGIYSAITRLCKNKGHTFIYENDLINETYYVMHKSVPKATIMFALDYFKSQLVDESIVYEDGKFFLQEYYDAEMLLNKMIRERLGEKILSEDERAKMIEEINDLAREEKILLASQQQEAVIKSQIYNLSILTGGPGTGKTLTIDIMIKCFLKRGKSVLLMAPTGCATKRMISATHYENGGTIHSKLGYFLDDEFVANRMVNEDVVIVDESSMIGCKLFRDIFTQVRPDATLIFVGDKDQLQSIEPGQVFTDMIDSKVIPTTILDHIFRQGQNSMIPINAKLINEGNPKMIWNERDFQLIRIEGNDKMIEEEISKKIPQIYEMNYENREYSDVQLLSPLRKKFSRSGKVALTSTEYLNPVIRDLINPYATPDSKEYVETYGKRFYMGDKVLETSNSNINGIVNGDIGKIIKIDPKDFTITIQFDEKTVKYKKENFATLTLAYGVSIHKSQGQEYPIVIIPLMKSYHRMLTRRLLYTAVTRAKEKVIFIGSLAAFFMAVNDDFSEARNTNLLNLLTQKAQ